MIQLIPHHGANGMNVLASLFDNGARYSVINIARCALSTIISTHSKDPVVSRFVKGVYNIRPSNCPDIRIFGM